MYVATYSNIYDVIEMNYDEIVRQINNPILTRDWAESKAKIEGAKKLSTLKLWIEFSQESHYKDTLARLGNKDYETLDIYDKEEKITELAYWDLTEKEARIKKEKWEACLAKMYDSDRFKRFEENILSKL
jgi:uncharacterized cupin superfamily protein